MNRRGFLGAILAAGAAPAIVKAASLMPVFTRSASGLFVPPTRLDVLYQFGAPDLILTLEDFAARVIEPAMLAVSRKLDEDALCSARLLS